ncbi:MAG: hypothetical protein QW303_02075 [Nitrososphaerota archaeon]
MFSKLTLSTITVCGSLSNIKHNENSLIHNLECTDKIIAIDSNFAHKHHPDFIKKQVKSNRGRKKIRKKRERRISGDGTCMSSQITFTIQTQKKYKVLLWRNGCITMPGIINRDLSDAYEVLDILIDYLKKNKIAEEIEIINLRKVMENYKFTIHKPISINRVYHLFYQLTKNLIHINFEDIRNFISNPVFIQGKSPAEVGWNECLDRNDWDLNWAEFKKSIRSGPLLVSEEKLLQLFQDERIKKIYQILKKWYDQKRFYILVYDEILVRIIYYLSYNLLTEWKMKLENATENLFSHIKYDSEIHSAFVLYIKINNKKITIKIFSNAINMSGGCLENIQKVYDWLNDLFISHNEIFKDYVIEEDDEFSSDPSD